MLILSCCFSGYAGAYAFFKRKMPGAKIGGLLIIHGSLWTFMYILQIFSRHIHDEIFFYKMQTMFGFMVPCIFAIYIARFFEIKLPYPKQMFIGVSIPPLIAALQILFNDPFHLMWKILVLSNYNQIIPYLGAYSQFIIIYNYLIMTILLGYFVFILIKPQQILKLRTLAFLISVIIYGLTYTFDVLGVTPHFFIFSSFIFNVLSSSIMLMRPEKMYKRDVLPVVYNLVIEKMTGPVIVTDRNDKLMYLNPAAKKLFGIEEILFLQQDLWDVFKSFYEYFIDGISDDEYFEFEDVIYRVGVYTIEDWQKVHRSVIYVLDDITEIVNYSKDLEVMVENKTNDLLESERLAAIGKMTSMVGHDLRNPLQVIRLIGSKLEERLKDDDNEYEMISKINKNILYMDKIVSDLQLLAKNRVPELSEVRLCALFEESIIALDVPDIVDFVCRISHEHLVYVEDSMFVRVFVNILNNAVQAMPEGGNIWVDCVKDDGFDVISVRDSGKGINEKHLVDMFKPFFTTKAKGMGLGLSVCKHIVESHGGEMWVESEEGKGAVFYIKIPSRDRLNLDTIGLEMVETISPQIHE